MENIIFEDTKISTVHIESKTMLRNPVLQKQMITRMRCQPLTRYDENEVDVSNSKHNDDECSDDDGDKIVCTRKKN